MNACEYKIERAGAEISVTAPIADDVLVIAFQRRDTEDMCPKAWAGSDRPIRGEAIRADAVGLDPESDGLLFHVVGVVWHASNMAVVIIEPFAEASACG